MVSANLDFSIVSHIDVTLIYPTLDAKQRQYRFTAEQPHHLFSCSYDKTAGDTYKLSYIVHYRDAKKAPLLVLWPQQSQNQPVVLTSSSSGILQTTFDASHVDFETQVDRITVAFAYQNASASEAPFLQTFTLNESAPSLTVQSLRSRPIGNKYTYTVTYHLRNGEQYKTLSESSNASTIYLFGPVKPMQLGVMLTGAQTPPVTQVNLSLYYLDSQGEKVPHTVTLTPDQATQSIAVYSTQTSGLPVYYQGMIQFQDGSQIVIEPTVTTSSVIIIDPAYRYFGLTMEPTGIRWENRLMQMQLNLTAVNSTSKATYTESFIYNEQAVAPRHWGFYVKRADVPQYTWSGKYFFDSWHTLRLPVIPDTTAHLALPSPPDASQMLTFIARAQSGPQALNAQAAANALQASPYFAPNVAAAVHAHYPSATHLASIVLRSFEIQVISRRNIAILTRSLQQIGHTRDQALGAVRMAYANNWPDDIATTVQAVYDQPIWRTAQELIAAKVPLRDAAVQLRSLYDAVASTMMLVLSASYYLVDAPNIAFDLGQAMQTGGYGLIETGSAMSWSHAPQWQLGAYRQLLNVFDPKRQQSVTQIARGYHAAGFGPGESARALYERYPSTSVNDMAQAIYQYWREALTPVLLIDALRQCRYYNAPYRDREIAQIVTRLFIPSPFPRPPFNLLQYPIVPVTANSGTEWGRKLLGASSWTMDASEEGVLTADQAIESVDPPSTRGLLTVMTGGPTAPVDVVSYVAVGGPGADEVDVAVYPESTTGETQYQGWTGSGWADRPAINTSGLYWYRLSVKWTQPYPNAVFYAKSYRHQGPNARPFKLWGFKESVFPSSFPRPPFDMNQYPLIPITATSGAEWAVKLLGASHWTLSPELGGQFNDREQCMESVDPANTRGLLTVLVSGPSERIDCVSYVAVGGPGAPQVDVAIYPQSDAGNTKYQGWNGSGWADAPAINTDGVYWYRLVARWAPPFGDPNAVFYAKTYRHHSSNGPAQPFKIWAYAGV